MASVTQIITLYRLIVEWKDDQWILQSMVTKVEMCLACTSVILIWNLSGMPTILTEILHGVSQSVQANFRTLP
jgi:hypothetical protein